jgi:predicted AlkP superfamily phosphohydrolase/phosphomutase
MWFSPAWPEMKAFALPSFSEGYVRINLQGREAQGIVSRSEYARVCDDVESLLRSMRDARTGTPLVADVLRPRADGNVNDPRLPDPDLLVLWTAQPTDVVDTACGRMGPMPFQRTGSHVARGFMLAAGPTVPAGQLPANAHALDLAPTILTLMNASIPAHCEGRPLFAIDGKRLVAAS